MGFGINVQDRACIPQRSVVDQIFSAEHSHIFRVTWFSTAIVAISNMLPAVYFSFTQQGSKLNWQQVRLFMGFTPKAVLFGSNGSVVFYVVSFSLGIPVAADTWRPETLAVSGPFYVVAGRRFEKLTDSKPTAPPGLWYNSQGAGRPLGGRRTLGRR